MPLPERVIVPVAVCRGTLSLPVPDELEGVTNGSLANIIRFAILTMLGIAFILTCVSDNCPLCPDMPRKCLVIYSTKQKVLK